VVALFRIPGRTQRGTDVGPHRRRHVVRPPGQTGLQQIQKVQRVRRPRERLRGRQRGSVLTEEIVQELFGHSSITVTRGYTHVASEMAKKRSQEDGQGVVPGYKYTVDHGATENVLVGRTLHRANRTIMVAGPALAGCLRSS
jgi:hypothetical protein